MSPSCFNNQCWTCFTVCAEEENKELIDCDDVNNVCGDDMAEYCQEKLSDCK